MTLTRFIYTLTLVGMFLAGVLWLGNTPPRESEAALFSKTEISGESIALRDEFLELLAALKTVQLDTSFFSDPRYLSLVDWSVTIKPQPVGRRNPFLPVGVDE
jgi:hypothetical protein